MYKSKMEALKAEAYDEIFCEGCNNTENLEQCDTCESGSNWDGEDEDERRTK